MNTYSSFISPPSPSNGVILKKGKESIFSKRHHWIFSGAIDTFPTNMLNGDTLAVFSHSGLHLGWAYFNRKTALCGRIISFDSTPPLESMRRSMENALKLRRQCINSATTGYRLINGEGDGLPGLIVDRYHSYLTIQIGTLGIERQKQWIIDQLVDLIHPEGIYEKSTMSIRKEEGLSPYEHLLFGSLPERIEISEESMRFWVSLEKGQKTGFFLDQRNMRLWIKHLAEGKSVLNCFCYSGGFSVAALVGGASVVDSVDISQDAIRLAEDNVLLNGFDTSKNGFYCQDVFDFLSKHSIDHDIVILDPPAFAKKKADIRNATKGYQTLNRLAMQKMRPNTLLLTCSCSYHISDDLFRKILFQAALDAKRELRIIGQHRLAADHPINIFHPESDYLKSYLLYLH